jgi:hypothetical protein
MEDALDWGKHYDIVSKNNNVARHWLVGLG